MKIFPIKAKAKNGESMNKSTLTEVFFAGEQKESDGAIWAEILREGEFATTPIGKSVLNKPFRVVRDGESSGDPDNTVVSMQELVDNFNDKAFEYVTIPLSHEDHLLENTGYIEELKIEEDESGIAKLWAKHRFTEPEVEEKVKRGSIPSRSAGIFFNFTRKADGKNFNAALKHVTPTDTPWITGLNPYGVFASDEDQPDAVSVATVTETKPVEVENHEIVEPEVIEVKPEFDAKKWFEDIQSKAQEALKVQLNLNGDHEIVVVGVDNVVVKDKSNETLWSVPYSLREDDDLELAALDQWQRMSGEVEKPSVATTAQLSDETPLQEAQKLRELRLSQRNGSNKGGKSHMRTRDIPQGLELSDEARGVFESLMAENESLQEEKRKQRVNERIDELKGLGLDKHPGFLKTVRDIYLSDDGGPAVVLNLSDEQGNVVESKEQTATDIVDRLLAALPRDKEQKILLSDQHHIEDGTHIKPDEGLEPDHDEMVKEWRNKLFPDVKRRKNTGGE